MNDFAWLFVLLALVFLFQGDPDVWDKLREKAMTMETCK
jgi:hypothetical protein